MGTLDEDGYGLAPVVSTRENESIRKAGGVPESTYDEPAALPGADDSSDTSDINGIDEAGGAYDEPVPMSAVKKLTKEEQNNGAYQRNTSQKSNHRPQTYQCEQTTLHCPTVGARRCRRNQDERIIIVAVPMSLN